MTANPESLSKGPFFFGGVSRESFFRILDGLGLLEHTRRSRLSYQEQKKAANKRRFMSDADMELEKLEIQRLSHLRLYLVDEFYETLGVAAENRVMIPITELMIRAQERQNAANRIAAEKKRNKERKAQLKKEKKNTKQDEVSE